MRGKMLFSSAILLALSRAGCSSPPDSPVVPPTPTITPAPPRGVPNAHALDNIALLRGLEAQAGRNTELYSVFGAGVRLDGRVVEGGGWSYAFVSAAGQPNVYQWSIYDTGAMALYTASSSIGTVADIGPGLTVDSDQAITVATANGGSDFVRRHPEAITSMTARRLANIVVWQIRFFVPGGQICELGPITIDASTGVLLARDLSCTS